MCPQLLSHVWLCIPMDCSLQGSSVHGIFLSGLLFPTPGDLPGPGVEMASLPSPVLVGRFFTTSATWKTFQAQVKQRRLSTEELMLSSCGAREDSWESFGQQGDQNSQT